MFKNLGNILLKGLLTILPIGLTLYFVYWLGVTTETLLSKPIKLVIDDANYWPGMGLVTGFLMLMVALGLMGVIFTGVWYFAGREAPAVHPAQSRSGSRWRRPIGGGAGTGSAPPAAAPSGTRSRTVQVCTPSSPRLGSTSET